MTLRGQTASESLLIPLPHLSAILHRAPVSGCIFSGNKLKQLRMTQFALWPWRHRLAAPSWGVGTWRWRGPLTQQVWPGYSLGRSSNCASLGGVSVFGPRTQKQACRVFTIEIGKLSCYLKPLFASKFRLGSCLCFAEHVDKFGKACLGGGNWGEFKLSA